MKQLLLLLTAIFYNCTFIAFSESKASSNILSEPAVPTEIVKDDGIQLRVLSWNIQNFGETKMKNDTIMEYIAEVVNSYDIVVIQEVSTSIYGAKAVAKLDAILDRMGSNWDYVISDPTEGSGKERYAYIFKPKRVKLKKAFLETALETSIAREPFIGIFEFQGTQYTFFNIHLVPEAKFPENEAKSLCMIEGYKGKNLVLGDFNLSQRHTAFDCLKKSYKPVLEDQKTSLKMAVKDGENLANEFDNAFVSPEVKIVSKGVVHFYKDFPDLKAARNISDHCPIFLTIK
jgi:endonuclease/exonuclease/phosphatase family metal-dependent hydrolase